MAPVIAITIIIATMFAQMCLFWVPMNGLATGWLPHQKAQGGLHWVWGVVMFSVAYGTLNQLIALTLSCVTRDSNPVLALPALIEPPLRVPRACRAGPPTRAGSLRSGGR